MGWTYSDAKEQPGFKKPQRTRRDCPVAGCSSSVLKLSQHLKQKHHLSQEESQKYLNISRIVSPIQRSKKEREGETTGPQRTTHLPSKVTSIGKYDYCILMCINTFIYIHTNIHAYRHICIIYVYIRNCVKY